MAGYGLDETMTKQTSLDKAPVIGAFSFILLMSEIIKSLLFSTEIIYN